MIWYSTKRAGKRRGAGEGGDRPTPHQHKWHGNGAWARPRTTRIGGSRIEEPSGQNEPAVGGGGGQARTTVGTEWGHCQGVVAQVSSYLVSLGFVLAL